MERYKCRLCFKSFINGKALGGHMRSHHMLNLASSDQVLLADDEDDVVTESDTSSYSSGEFDNLLKRTHLDADDDDVTKISPRKKRSKRTRKLGSFDDQHHSSASDTTTEEDLAFCLIMLSRDKWKLEEEEQEVEEDETDYECEDKNIKGGGRGRFKCETCGKVFKSYQALGGHRASHKKNKTFTTSTTTTKTEQDRTEFDRHHHGVVKEKKVHQCPICFRVFSSGQALGGHKRSHGSNNNNNIGGGGGRGVMSLNHQEEVLVKERVIDLDLNLPAPNEDYDDEETSLVFDEW